MRLSSRADDNNMYSYLVEADDTNMYSYPVGADETSMCGFITSSPAKVSLYLPFDKPFTSRPSKFIISVDLSINENTRKDFFYNPFLPIR